ncbi:MAG: arylsulfatase, partial [Gemmatimonadaceae bacterium]|nr:arylsulfatase [Gemmatimonadaceae bacterium]
YFPLTAPHTPIAPLDRFRGTSEAGEYGDYVCEVDWCVGQVVEALERTGKARDTLLIFTSDNGPENFAYERIQQHGHYSMGDLRGIKRDAWEGGHRLPFVARWPGVVEAGSTCDHLTTLGDLLATAAELAGTGVPAGAGEDSVSIAPLLRGGGADVRSCAMHHSMKGKYALRRGDWVFIDAPTGDDNAEPDWFRAERGYTPHDCPGELYDLRVDLSQAVNRYADHPDVVAEMKELLDRVRAGCDQSVKA